MAKNGYTKIPKDIMSQPWANNPNAVFLYTWLSINADENGQVRTSRADLSERTGLSDRQLRTAIEKLEATKHVTKLATKLPTKFATVLTVSYLASYEVEKIATDQVIDQATDQVIDQPSCVYKNDNIIISSHSKHTVDINKKKTTSTKVELVKEKESTAPPIAPLMARMEKFYNELIPFVDTYGKELIRNFYDYWSEPNRSKTKMRYELQPTWDLKRRLATWAKKDKNYTTNGNRANITTAERSVNDAAALVQRLLRTNK